jgi:uncharacterized membrane protein
MWIVMSNPSLRFEALREYLRSSLWLLPSVSVLAAFALGTGLSALTVPVVERSRSVVDFLIVGGGSAAARGLLETVASSVITVTSLVFSLTVVALQLTTTAYSPRVLRGFLRDRGNQAVLSVFLATFAYSYAVLRAVPSQDDTSVPVLAVNMLLPFVLASLTALVYFIHHLTQALRVETILDGVHDETLETIDRVYPQSDPGARQRSRAPLPEPPPWAVPLRARRGGRLQDRRLDRLAEQAANRDVTVCLRQEIGEHVVPGSVVAEIWPRADGTPLPRDQTEKFEQLVHDALLIGRERTMQQDVAFGIRQLVDIALRALSPGMNDPTTAIEAINRLAVVLTVLAERPLSPLLQHDEDGNVRVVAPAPGFGDYLDLACTQIRHYGSSDPVVARRLAQVLDELRTRVTFNHDQREVDLQRARLSAAVHEQGDDVEITAAKQSTEVKPSVDR